MVEAMIISSRSKEVKSKEPIKAILATEHGKDLLSLLKQLKETEISFQLSQIQSLDMLVNIIYLPEDTNVEYYPNLNFGKSRSVLAANIAEIYYNNVLEDEEDACLPGASCLPVKVQQELKKQRKKIEATLGAMKKKYSFSLKEVPTLQVDIMITFSDLSFGEDFEEDLIFLPNLNVKPKPGAKILSESLETLLDDYQKSTLEEMLLDAYQKGTLENDLPADISAKIKAADTLQEKITKLANTLARKHRWDDCATLLREFADLISPRRAS